VKLFNKKRKQGKGGGGVRVFFLALDQGRKEKKKKKLALEGKKALPGETENLRKELGRLAQKNKPTETLTEGLGRRVKRLRKGA